MTKEEHASLEETADKIIKVAKTRKDANAFIKQFIVSVAECSMKTEREDWLCAAECLGPKTKEKLMKARFKDE